MQNTDMGLPRVAVRAGNVRLIVRGRAEFGQVDSIIVLTQESVTVRTIEARLRALGWPRSESKCVANVLQHDIECMLRLQKLGKPVTLSTSR